MRLLKRGCLQLLLKLTAALGTLCMITLLSWPKSGWDPTYILKYSWLEFTDADGDPENVCNCSAILQGERETLEQAKLLAITKDFRKSVQIPDEYYINATKDCRCVALKNRFKSLYMHKSLYKCFN